MTHRLVQLPHHSADLLARLRLAIDPGRMLDALNQHWSWASNRGFDVASLEVHRVFPRGEDRFIVKYHLTLKDGDKMKPMVLFGELAGTGIPELYRRMVNKLHKSRRKQIDRNQETDGLVILQEPEMLLRIPGLDDKLPGLTLLHQDKRRRLFLRQFSESLLGGEVEGAELTILNHRPGKRCVLAARRSPDDDSNALVIRCLKEGRSRQQENYELITALRNVGFGDDSKDDIRIPKALGYDDTLATVVIEYVPGEILGRDSQWDGLHQGRVAASAIAKLHKTPLQIDKRYHPEDELDMLADWVALTSALRPDLSEKLEWAYAQVSDQFARLSAGPLQLVHRDFYCKQLIHDGNKTFLIDFDTLCMADPAIDIANYLAHEQLSQLTGGGNAVLVDDFMGAYAAIAPLPPDNTLKAWHNAALLRLSCLYCIHTGWEVLPASLIDKISV